MTNNVDEGKSLSDLQLECINIVNGMIKKTGRDSSNLGTIKNNMKKLFGIDTGAEYYLEGIEKWPLKFPFEKILEIGNLYASKQRKSRETNKVEWDILVEKVRYINKTFGTYYMVVPYNGKIDHKPHMFSEPKKKTQHYKTTGIPNGGIQKPETVEIEINKLIPEKRKVIKKPVLLNASTTEEERLITDCVAIMVVGKSITGQPYIDIVTVANQSNTLREFFDSMIFKSYRKHMSKKIVLRIEKYLILAGYSYEELYSIFKIDEFNIPSPLKEEMDKIEEIIKIENEKVLEPEHKADEIDPTFKKMDNGEWVAGQWVTHNQPKDGIVKLEPLSDEVLNSFKLPECPKPLPLHKRIINGFKKLFKKESK